MAEEHTSHDPYGRIKQSEVCQLLSSGYWVVYPEGLNGCQVPVIMTLPESLSQCVAMLKGESTFLQVDLSQSTTQEQEPRTPSSGSDLSLTLTASPVRAFPPKVEGQISMTMEFGELLSWASLNTSGLASGSSTQKDWDHWSWLHCYLLSQRTPPDWWITLLKWVLQRMWR